MSGTGESAAMVVMKPGKNCGAGLAGTKGIALTGGGAIDFPTRNRPSPCPDYFERAKRERSRDRRYIKNPR